MAFASSLDQAGPIARTVEDEKERYILEHRLLPPDGAPEASREKVLAAGFNYAQIELLNAYAIMPGMHLRGYEASTNRSRIAQGWAMCTRVG